MKNLFIGLYIVGVVAIIIGSFTIPSNPNEIIPALTVASFDKPLWLCLIITGVFFYSIILYAIYDKIKNKARIVRVGGK